MPLIRRNTSSQRLLIDPLHGSGPTPFDHLKPLRELAGKTRPGGAKFSFDAARSPVAGPLAEMVGSEEPDGPGPGQVRFLRQCRAMGEADAPRIFYLLAEMTMEPCAQVAVACHVDEGDRRIWRERGHLIVGHDLVIAAERGDEARIRGRGQPDHFDPGALAVHEMREPERGLAGSGGQDHAARAEKIALTEKIIDQER